MVKRSLRLLHLYPDLMNIYGDRGNILALRRRALAREIDFSVMTMTIGDKPAIADFDLLFFGGGQDKSQEIVAKDIVRHRTALAEAVRAGVSGLLICGGYQLFGKSFLTSKGESLKGLGILPAETKAGQKRLIGNLVCETNLPLEPATLVGFENHSGQTLLLSDDATPLGRVEIGSGNASDRTEGCIFRNIIGSYMHGSLLPKNPHLADFLLRNALAYRGQETTLTQIDDSIEWNAHHAAIKRAGTNRSLGIS
jgi:CobQ-like glutamine amidotransferase family enzyme